MMRSRTALAGAALAVLLAGCGSETEGDGGDRGGGAKSAGGGSEGAGARGGWPAEEAGHGAPELRAVVTEEGSGRVRVVDLASGDTVGTLNVEGQAAVVRAEDDTHVLLAQGEEKVTHLLDAGIRWEDHGGHKDPHHEDPSVVGRLDGTYPSHVVPHGEHVTVFDDGEGKASVLHVGEEHATVEPERELTLERPHHGVAVELESGEMVATVPEKDEEELPKGVRVYDENDKPTQTFANCPGLHGEFAASDDRLLFGCADGVLVLERKGGAWTSSKIANPAGTQREEHVSGFAGEGDAVLGTFGDNAMVTIDAEKKEMKRIPLPAARATAIWDPYWEQGVVLTENGELHGVDPDSGELTGSTRVTEAFELSEDWTKDQPSIATGESAVYVTDPYSGSLIEAEVSRDGFEVTRTKELDFTPYSISVLGMAG